MYGLVHRALQTFAQDTYGDALWRAAVAKAGLDVVEFEAMLTYSDEMFDAVLDSLSDQLSRDRALVLEDLGSYLVTHPNTNVVRRLLRFGGFSFVDFVLSLDDLQDRTKLAFPDLHLPRLEVEPHLDGAFGIWVFSEREGFGAVLQGVLRAMADDYGALVMLELRHATRYDRSFEHLTVELFETDFAAGRSFDLSMGHAAK
ncbi:heme-NO-binding protein [Litoreibacter ponti]|uniref:Heme-NO-binding protein n=1 Tax=Litoreibacter ponti TaxID=1510457 RepID=A0A2T6BE33_9RHOB|nr:heme NO-binding domain-containing protein [Litoreibacter ponti]PTX54304.1 heme-NO-binding protein [Litoreibacter ponti]